MVIVPSLPTEVVPPLPGAAGADPAAMREVVVSSCTSLVSNVRIRIQTATAKTTASAAKKSGRKEILFRG
jgi:hypothetical protein